MTWVKIMCDILAHRKITMIRKGPEGNTLVLLWLLMLTEAGKCNRGGYLMISDNMPYTVDTLSMIMDIPLPTVQLGLAIFAKLDMIDQHDNAIFIKNWTKYQSEDQLELRRANERKRQQQYRQKEREKMRALPAPDPEHVSRDSHVSMSRGCHKPCHVTMSRDVTLENRQDKNRVEKTTTEQIRLLLSETPLSKISDQELLGLEKRHGLDRLQQAADVAAETWRRSREEMHNPGGYLQALCTTLVMPDWYVSWAERIEQAKASQLRKAAIAAEKANLQAQEETQSAARDALWTSLSDAQREKYRTMALAGLPAGITTPSVAITAMAKLLAWEAAQSVATLDES